MKLKLSLAVAATLLAGGMYASATTMIVSNVDTGIGDTLYANSNGTLMNSGLVTMGYFAAGVTQSQIDTVPELLAQLTLGNFTLVTSAIPGATGPTLGAVRGYAEQSDPTSIGIITGANALLGRVVYSIVTDATSFTVGAGVGQINGGSHFAMVSIGTIVDDNPNESNFTSNPKGLTPIIGTNGTFNGSPGVGADAGAYNTLIMAIPETSSVLLGALGMLGLLRRRR
ncbi:MAG: hypothetical protein WCP45_06490 [Verrucomicrobiota bacterium]